MKLQRRLVDYMIQKHIQLLNCAYLAKKHRMKTHDIHIYIYIHIHMYIINTQYTSSAYTHNVLLPISAGPTMQVPSISSLSHGIQWFWTNATFGFDLSLYPASIYHHSLLMSHASFRCCYTSIPGATTCRRPVLGREVRFFTRYLLLTKTSPSCKKLHCKGQLTWKTYTHFLVVIC